MSEFLKITALSNNSTFKTKVRMAALKAAGNVLAEPSRESEFPYFKHIISAPLDEGWLVPICYQAGQNPSLLASTDEEGNCDVPDGDIEFTVNSVITKFSVPLAATQAGKTGMKGKEEPETKDVVEKN